MPIRSNLFNTGHPLKAEPGLSDALENHKRSILNKISVISNVDQMTDAFLGSLVQDALVVPLTIHFDRMTRKLRTETLDASYLPADSMGAFRYSCMGDFPLQGGNQKQIARLTVPFSGEGDLLKYSPSPGGLTFPRGQVSGKTIQFDVILWGRSDDAQRIKDEIRNNLTLIADYAAKINLQVKSFNESLPEQVKAAFTTKFAELTSQHAVFDELGIPEEPDPLPLGSGPMAAAPKKREPRTVQIIQHVKTMFVQQLNQTNYNVGDVNNAIQSAE